MYVDAFGLFQRSVFGFLVCETKRQPFFRLSLQPVPDLRALAEAVRVVLHEVRRRLARVSVERTLASGRMRE